MPNRRKATSSSKAGSSSADSANKSKRIKLDNFGAANDTDDLPPAHVAAQQQQLGPSSAEASVCPNRRTLAAFPTLASLAARVFATHFNTLYILENEYLAPHRTTTRQKLSEKLSELPENLIPKLLALLREHSPTYLNAGVLITYFLRGREIHLPGELPGVNVQVVNAIGTQSDAGIITTLDLSRLTKINDQVLANVVSRLPGLEKLILRGCSKAGPLVLEAAAVHCPQLQILNMNYTVATPHTIMSVLLACPQLEVLKIAGIPKLVAGCIPALKKSHENEYLEPIPIFPALRSLKLRLTELANSDLAALLPHCPNLTTLDISFTLIKHIPLDSPFPQLKKLCLTSTSISGTNLVNVLKRVPMLEVLYLGALGDSVPSTSKGAGTGVSAGTLTDSLLRDVTDALERCPNLKNVNLVSNLKLGSGGSVDRALRDFVRRVGRNCEILNFENVPQLRSEDLEGLLRVSDDDDPSPIRVLNVARTNVNGDSAMYIAACQKLEVLNVASTKLGREELFTILDCCPDIVELDLTGCRSVSVKDRRRFFETWEFERRMGKSTSEGSD